MAGRLFLLAAAGCRALGSAPAVAVVSGEQAGCSCSGRPGAHALHACAGGAEHRGGRRLRPGYSFGRVSFSVATPWLRAYSHPPLCDRLEIANGRGGAARAAGYDPSAFTQIAYLYPSTDRFWTGRVTVPGS